MREARRLVYRGHVQGVGFRRRVERLAALRPVAGYVQNLPDGSVRLEVEADADALREFLAAVGAELHREIQAVDETAIEPPGHQGFVIRR